MSVIDTEALKAMAAHPVPDFGTVHHMPTEGNAVYIKQMHLAAGFYVDTHKHNFDHFGLLGSGIAKVKIDGAPSKVFNAPCVIEIKADLTHTITALTDITWFCIHASEETDASKIDATLIKEG